MASTVKNPVKVRAGAIGARKRWGEPRHAKLNDLDPRIAAAIRALIAADVAAREAAAAVSSETPATANAGGQANAHAAT